MQKLLKRMPDLCFGKKLSLYHLRESTAIPKSRCAIKSKQQRKSDCDFNQHIFVPDQTNWS